MTSNSRDDQTWLIIPALNEAENLEWLLPLVVPFYRILISDNGSTDGSAMVGEKHGAQVVKCESRGYGNAVQAGLRYIASNLEGQSPENIYVVIFDADGTSPVSYIQEIIGPLKKGTHDFVLGQRTSRERFAMPPHAKFGNWLATFLIHKLTNQTYSDMGPLRGLTLASFQALKLQDKTWGWNVEMQVKAAMARLKIKEIDISYKNRRYGRSKISGSIIGSIRAGSRIIWSVFFYYRQGKAIWKFRKD